MRVLLVEDEPELAALVAARLERAGWLVDRAGALGDAEALVDFTPYALAVIDRRLPDGDGLSLLATLRRRQPEAKALMLTALDAPPQRVAGLDAGADDYLVKPFDMEELVARVRAALRPRGAAAEPACCGALRFDPARREASAQGAPLVLPRRELALLEALILRAGRVVLRETLTEALWGLHEEVEPNALDVAVSRLRRRLAGAGVEIHAVRGVGYLMRAA